MTDRESYGCPDHPDHLAIPLDIENWPPVLETTVVVLPPQFLLLERSQTGQVVADRLPPDFE